MTATEHGAHWYPDPRDEDAARRLLIPLDSESRTMLDELVQHFYPKHNQIYRGKYRGLVIEMAIRALYQRTAPKQPERKKVGCSHTESLPRV